MEFFRRGRGEAEFLSLQQVLRQIYYTLCI